jgi:hypothetical protein
MENEDLLVLLETTDLWVSRENLVLKAQLVKEMVKKAYHKNLYCKK